MRLIDADKFLKEHKEIADCEIDHMKYQDTIRELIESAPTAIQKVIRVQKKHIVAVSRYAYSLTGVYQQIIEELIDSGVLVIERKINSDILEFIWHLETESEHG